MPAFGATAREAVANALADVGAEKCGESGSPAYEVNNEYFRVGRRRIRVCTEDGMFVSIWGPRGLVDEVCARTIENLKTKAGPGA